MRVKLGDVCERGSSGLKQSDVEGKTGDYPIYGAAGQIGYVDFYHQERPYVAVVKDGAGIGRTTLLPAKSSVIGTMQYLLPKGNVLPEYLCYVVKHMHLEKYYSGATIPHIYFRDYQNEEFCLAEPDKQAEIVDILGRVERTISHRQHQLSTFDQLIKARFVELFGDPYSNPRNWKQMTFKEASTRLSDGPFGSNLKSEHYSDTGVRVIRLGNIGVGTFIDDDKSFIPVEHYEKLKKYTCSSGEIVIGTLGDPNLRACIIPQDIGIAINKADCVHFIPKHDVLNATFACQYINCPETLLLAQGMIHGQTRARVSSGQIAEMHIFIPPMNLQNEFASFVSRVDKSKLSIQASLDQLETLKQSLMQKYFG